MTANLVRRELERALKPPGGRAGGLRRSHRRSGESRRHPEGRDLRRSEPCARVANDEGAGPGAHQVPAPEARRPDRTLRAQRGK